ncbi:hypothetical protein VTK26DRAFT_7818 [Humicola hyalothermophila]
MSGPTIRLSLSPRIGKTTAASFSRSIVGLSPATRTPTDQCGHLSRRPPELMEIVAKTYISTNILTLLEDVNPRQFKEIFSAD